MANYLSPLFNEQTFDANGNPLVNGQIETYVAGTSTPLQTYTTQNGFVQHANPIILDSRGEPADPIWLAANQEYKFILKTAAGVTIRTIDDVAGINDVTSSGSEWLPSGFTPTFISGTSFSVAGDRTGTLTVGRRIKTTNTGGTIYSTISNSVFGVVTTVTVINDSGVLDSGLSDISYGLISSTNPSLPNSQAVRQTMGFGSGADIASAATLNLTGRTGKIVRITGATGPITAVTMNNGDEVLLISASTPTFNVSGVLSYTCVAEDMILFVQDRTGVQHAFVYAAVAQASTTVAGKVELATDAEVTTGTDTSRVPSVASMRNSFIVLNTAVSVGTGTSVDWNGIPSWAKRVLVHLIGVSTGGSSNLALQGIVGGSAVNSGYTAVNGLIQSGATGVTGSSTTMIPLATGSASSTTIFGTVNFERLGSSNDWMVNYVVNVSSTPFPSVGSAYKAFSGALDGIRLTSDGGSALDAGSWSVSWE